MRVSTQTRLSGEVLFTSGTLGDESCYDDFRLAARLWIMRVEVVTYSGFRADERPLRFTMNGVTREIVTVHDRWYGPGDSWFRVEAEDGGLYVLRYRTAEDCWTVESFRVAK